MAMIGKKRQHPAWMRTNTPQQNPKNLRFRDAPKAANLFAHGSGRTKKNRASQAARVFDELRQLTGVSRPTDLRRHHVAALVASWQGKIAPGTQAARLAALRAALSGMDIDPAPVCGRVGVAGENARLGVPPIDRVGQHTATSPEEFDIHFAARVAAGGSRYTRDPGLLLAAHLQYHLGLRAREVVMLDLSTVEQALRSGRSSVPLITGTKGGKVRDIHSLHPDHLDEIKRLVAAAREHLGKRGAHLVKSASLEGAERRYQRFWHSLGLTGDRASHSARYWSAQRAVEYRVHQLGMSQREARARTVSDLGHGAGRHTWLRRIYLNNLADRQKK